MSPGQKFCTSCGAPNIQDQWFCTRCGAGFGTGQPMVTAEFPVTDSGLPPADDSIKNPEIPRTLPALLHLILTRMVHNIRGMVKVLIVGMIFAFAIVLLINTFLQATSLSQNEIVKFIIAAAGFSSSPDALFFWFLFTAILAFFWSQLVSRGVRSTLGKLATLPRWILTSVKTTGSTAFPLVMAGIAVALLVRLFLLTTVTGIQFLILMFGILYSQQESLAVLAMSLGYSDLNRLIRKSEPVIPAPGFPVMGVVGAFCGFLIALFIADSLFIIAGVVILMVIGTVAVWYRRRRAAPAITASPAGTSLPGGRGP